MKAREYLSEALQKYLSGKGVEEADEAAISIIEKYGQECFCDGVEAMLEEAIDVAPDMEGYFRRRSAQLLTKGERK